MQRGITISRGFTVVTAVSSLLLVAMVVVWIRSYWIADTVHWSAWEYNGSEVNRQLEERTLNLGSGIVCYGHEFTRGNTNYFSGLRTRHGDRDRWMEWTTKPASTGAVRVGGSGFWNEHGFAYVYNRSDSSLSSYVSWWRGIMLPLWTLCLLFGLLPISALFVKMKERRRRVRRRPGHCGSCGYDLRARPERCPECGTAIPAMVAEDGR